MSSWKYTDFRPKWALNPDDRELLGQMPDIGRAPEPVPSVAMRLVPTHGRSAISATTLSEAVLVTQRIFLYATHEVVRGIDPAFSDLRRIDEQCQLLGRLEFEPFEEGSFIIPAELRSEPIARDVGGVAQIITTAKVLARFNAVIAGVMQQGIDLQVSIGFLSELSELRKLLKREVASLEFLTTLPQERGRSVRARHLINEEYLARVTQVRDTRRRTQIKAGDALVGTLVAVDFETHKLRVRLDSPDQITVPGTFLPVFEQVLLASLMKRARFLGTIKYVDGIPKHLDLVKLEPLAE